MNARLLAALLAVSTLSQAAPAQVPGKAPSNAARTSRKAITFSGCVMPDKVSPAAMMQPETNATSKAGSRLCEAARASGSASAPGSLAGACVIASPGAAAVP